MQFAAGLGNLLVEKKHITVRGNILQRQIFLEERNKKSWAEIITEQAIKD